MNKYSTVLFDLDGTVADTAPDLKRAADHVLSGLGRRTLSEEEAYRTAPLGMTAMLKASLGDDIGRYDVEELKTGFLRYYRQNIHAATRLYPGIREVLSAIRESQRLWGIVTNKPMFLTEELVASFPELSGPAVIIAGDSVVRHKPDPEPVLRAIELTGSAPGATLMVGDSLSDVKSAVSAGAAGVLAQAETPLDLLSLIWQ